MLITFRITAKADVYATEWRLFQLSGGYIGVTAKCQKKEEKPFYNEKNKNITE